MNHYNMFIRKLLKPSFTRAFRPSQQFCSGVQKKSIKDPVLQDWQYCKVISQQLKSNRVNSALSLLFQSYFNAKILDIQIYNSIFQSISDAGLSLSYSEIVYQIYREHFPPHSLFLNWMNKLTATRNEVLLQLLKQDYEAIHQPFPQKKSPRREPKPQRQNPIIKESTEQAPKIRTRVNRKTDPQSKTLNLDFKNLIPEVELIDPQKATPQELIKIRLAAQFRNMLQQFNNDLNFNKINLYDVQIEMNDHEDMANEHEDFQYQEEDGENMDMPPSFGLLDFDIKKIKIGRIEFLSDNPSPNDKNDP